MYNIYTYVHFAGAVKFYGYVSPSDSIPRPIQHYFSGYLMSSNNYFPWNNWFLGGSCSRSGRSGSRCRSVSRSGTVWTPGLKTLFSCDCNKKKVCRSPTKFFNSFLQIIVLWCCFLAFFSSFKKILYGKISNEQSSLCFLESAKDPVTI